MLSLSFLTLVLTPVAVSAAQGTDCTANGQADCDAKESCSLNTNDTTPGDGDMDRICTSPTGTEYGLTEFTDVGLGQTSDVKGSIANIINIVLGFLGIVAVIIILAGGFKWMTAGGNEDNVASARQMIIQGVIGLVVIFAAWAIASFVVSNLQSATTA